MVFVQFISVCFVILVLFIQYLINDEYSRIRMMEPPEKYRNLVTKYDPKIKPVNNPDKKTVELIHKLKHLRFYKTLPANLSYQINKYPWWDRFVIGLNILKTPFVMDPVMVPKNPDSFYFTTKDFVQLYTNLAVQVHEIELPWDDPELLIRADGGFLNFSLLKGFYTTKGDIGQGHFRANKIIIKDLEPGNRYFYGGYYVQRVDEIFENLEKYRNLEQVEYINQLHPID